MSAWLVIFLFGLFHFISWNGSKIVWLFNKFLYIFSFNFQTSMTSKFGLLKRKPIIFYFVFFDTCVQNWVIDLSSEIFFVLLCWPWLECLTSLLTSYFWSYFSVCELFSFRSNSFLCPNCNLPIWKKTNKILYRNRSFLFFNNTKLVRIT